MENSCRRLILIYGILCVCTAQLQFSLPGQPNDVVVSSTSNVYVSTVNGVYRLNGSLVQQEILQFNGTTGLRISLSSDESRLIVCLNNNSCIDYNARYLTQGPVSVFQSILATTINTALVSAPVSGGGNSFYVGSSNGSVNLIGQYGLDGTARNVSRSSGNLFSVTASSFTRNWFGGFVAGNYTYFVVLDVNTLSPSKSGIRVLRVCGNSYETSITAMYELQLDCLFLANNPPDSNSRLVGASLVSYPVNGGGAFEQRLVIGIVTPKLVGGAYGGSYLNRMCTYRLSDIDLYMNNSYTNLASSQYSSGSLPWLSSPATFTYSTPCNLSSPGAIGASTLLSYSMPTLIYLLAGLATNPAYELSYTLVLNTENVTIVFVASTSQINQQGTPKLEAYNPTDGAAILGNSFSSWTMPGPVTKLTWTSGQNYVYAITSTSVVQVPIEQCFSFTDCLSCAANVNPLCGWCTVEQKCSRRSQCQNSTVSTRWVQGGTSLCLSNTSVTPTKFVLESLTNITLTISSGLLPLLSGESFLCLLTTGSGVTISVPYSQVNQTTFRSNITGAISQLNVPKLVITFSFASSMFNISFAASSNNLTAYNCPLYKSCSSCLQSDGVCGWCNVEKRCTAVTSSCSNGISVNTTGGQTYLDVCPSLLNGTYLLPVTISKELLLTTKNLPPQISGYTYTCNITLPNGPISLPTSNISNTSIKCLFTAAQISLPVGTTAMVANISLIWTNSGTVMYPIDPLGVIQVTLYNCSAVIPVCTSCLAVNFGTGYDCGWCNGINSCVEPETCSSTFANQSYQCPSPVLSSVSPTSGPSGGGTNLTITGTNLGVKVGEIVNVNVGGVSCVVQSYGYIPGIQVMCVTGAYTSGGTQQNFAISVLVNISGAIATAQSNFLYTYVKPSISSVFPKSGPMSGGTNVVIGGMFLNVGNGLKKVLLNGAVCVILQSSLTQVTCTSSAQNVTGVGGFVTVYIDNDTTTNSGVVTFEYTNNPNYTSVSPASTIPAGGIILTFTGTYLNVTQRALFKLNGMVVNSSCNQSFTTLKCIAPPLGSNLSGPGVSLFPGVNYTIVMDGAPGPTLTIGVVPNPVFTSINPGDRNQTSGSVKSITIIGTNIINVALIELMVTVGGQPCVIDKNLVTANALSCNPPNFMSTTISTTASYNVTVSVGLNLLYNVGSLQYTSTAASVVQAFPVATVAGAVSAGGVVVVVVVIVIVSVSVAIYARSAKKKEAQVANLLMQMETMESAMADECKRAFTELQTDLHDVTNVQDRNYPFRDFQTFAMRCLFPSAGDDHIVLKPVQLHKDLEEEMAMRQLQTFKHLLLDKKFLLTLIRTLETQQGRFTLQDRCNFASMLMIALQNELPYATEILTALLTDLMRSSASRSHPKLLLRRTESVAEKLLGNWLCFLLFPFILEHAGEPLFVLFRAIKSQLEKGPVDVITGEARNSLSEEKLLRQHLDVNTVEGVVDTGVDDGIPIRLLSSDTITQAKEKVLDTLYRNCPTSNRPQLTDVDLELKRGNAGIPLRDHDDSNERDGDWIKINTLGHYKLDTMSKLYAENPKNPQPRFSLLPRHQRPVSIASFDTIGTIISNMAAQNSRISLMSEGPHVYHLVKPEQVQAGQEGEPSRHGKIVSEVFLTRLLSTKRIIQPYVDSLFQAIFCIPRGKPLPKAIKYLFDFLDVQAADMGIQDPDVLHTWKTNSLPLRFWVNVIKNPDFVFDIHKSATVDSCLSVISQTYIDACSTSEAKYTKDTPSSKLLYVNEVKGYKTHVQQYYNTIQSLPKMEKLEMEEYLKEGSQTHHQYFVTESALYELAKYGVTYSAQVVAALSEDGLTDTTQMFEEVVKGLTP